MMSKFKLVLSLTGLCLFLSCGQSAEEREAEKVRTQDSINAADAAEIAAEEAAMILAKSDSTMLADTSSVDITK